MAVKLARCRETKFTRAVGKTYALDDDVTLVDVRNDSSYVLKFLTARSTSLIAFSFNIIFRTPFLVATNKIYTYDGTTLYLSSTIRGVEIKRKKKYIAKRKEREKEKSFRVPCAL